jgi:potassium efflux system protein
MMETVLSTPLVLSDPAPSVFIVGFGDNSLLFSIRIFVAEVVNRLPVSHHVLLRLEKALREHKINMPFPQRDIHIRSVTSDSINISNSNVKTD